MWITLTVIAAISLVIYWRGPNSVWGGITFGFIGGLIVAVVSAILGNGFHWTTIGRGIVLGILLGAAAELLSKAQSQKNEITGQ